MIFFADVGERQLALEAAHLHEADGIARLGDERGFHPLLGADKSNLRARRNRFDAVGDGDGGIDMAAGAAAGHQYFQTLYTYLSAKGGDLSPFDIGIPRYGENHAQLDHQYDHRRAAVA